MKKEIRILLLATGLLSGCVGANPTRIAANTIDISIPISTQTPLPLETETETYTATSTTTSTRIPTVTFTSTPPPFEWAHPSVIVECCSSSGEKLAALLKYPENQEKMARGTGVVVLSTGIGGLDYLGVEQNLDRIFLPGFVPAGAVVELDGPAKNGEIQGLTPEQNFTRLKSLVEKLRTKLGADQNHILIVVDQVRPSAMPGLDLTVQDDAFNDYLETHFPELGPGLIFGKIHKCYEFPGSGRTDPGNFDITDGLHFPGIDGYVALINLDLRVLNGYVCP